MPFDKLRRGLRFNAKGPGKASILDDSHRKTLAAIVEVGPIPASYGVVRWRIVDLTAWLWDEFGLSVTRYTLGRELRGLGYRKLSARPRHHDQADDAIPELKNFIIRLAEIERSLPSGTPIELCWQDEARAGKKNGITRRWAKRGTRPSAPKDQRTRSAYIFGAICPAEGKGAGLVLPWCNSEGMELHLKEISFHVAPSTHGVLMLDQAGWHMSGKLHIPDNITLLPIPAKCPELNPVENVGQFMRENWLDQPWRIMSIGLRQWAHGF